MQTYDTRLKSILYRSAPRLFRLLGLPPVKEFLSIEFPLREKAISDWVVRLTDGRILHLELQSRNDSRMLFRCLDYWKEICERWPGVEIVQVVIYLGDGPMTMVSRITNGENHYGFDILCLKDVEAQEFVESDSATERILAVLCQSPDPRATIRAILGSWKHLSPSEISENINDMAVLSQLRKRDTMVREESKDMPIEIDLRENAFVKWGEELGEARGLAEGIAKGESKALTKILERRFGHIPEAIRAKIASADTGALDHCLDRVIDAASLDAVFAE